MEEYKIKGIDTTWRGSRYSLAGFRLEGVTGTVDVFLGEGLAIPLELEAFRDDDGEMPFTDEFCAAEIKWAERQIGKTLKCGELVYKAFATSGVALIEGEGDNDAGQ